MCRFDSPIFGLYDYALCKHEALNLFSVWDCELNFHVKTAGFSPLAVLHTMSFDLLVSSDTDVVSKKSDLFRAVRYVGLLFAEFEFQLVCEEFPYFRFQLFAFLFGTANAYEPVIGISDKGKLLVRHPVNGNFMHFLSQCLVLCYELRSFVCVLGVINPVGYLLHLIIDSSVGIGLDVCDIASPVSVETASDFVKFIVEFVQIYIRQYWGTYASLRSTAVSLMV